jgi:hypothetical protein
MPIGVMQPLVVFAAFSALVLACSPSEDEPDEASLTPLTIETASDNHQFSVKIADTVPERALGPVNRHELAADTGMLFVYDTEQKVRRAGRANEDLAEFLDSRVPSALALSLPIAACVVRRDTAHPAFHGCVDWHSSVHGVWALLAYTWMTGDQRYRELVQAQLDPALLEQERVYLNANPSFEMPYGRAWFLRLATDHQRAFQDERLSALADNVAQSLMDYYTRIEPDPLSTAYDSATWALINLFDFGQARRDQEILAFVQEKVRAHYLGRAVCPLQEVEVAPREFMAVCTNWAWLVGMVTAQNEFKVFVGDFLPPALKMEPITDEASIHQAGLNFSRAWGLWNVYRLTGETRFLEAYLGHFRATFERPQIWQGDYRSHAHWVAQFGMLALAVTAYGNSGETLTRQNP